MFKPVKLPRGVANIFLVGNSANVKLKSNAQYRPDKILEVTGNKSVLGEMINNYMSNKSPITLHSGDEYKITDSLFNAYFGGSE